MCSQVLLNDCHHVFSVFYNHSRAVGTVLFRTGRFAPLGSLPKATRFRDRVDGLVRCRSTGRPDGRLLHTTPMGHYRHMRMSRTGHGGDTQVSCRRERSTRLWERPTGMDRADPSAGVQRFERSARTTLPPRVMAAYWQTLSRARRARVRKSHANLLRKLGIARCRVLDFEERRRKPAKIGNRLRLLIVGDPCLRQIPMRGYAQHRTWPRQVIAERCPSPCVLMVADRLSWGCRAPRTVRAGAFQRSLKVLPSTSKSAISASSELSCNLATVSTIHGYIFNLYWYRIGRIRLTRGPM